MVSFQCDNCCDVVKKPKLDQHRQRCHATFTCIDCSTTFQNTDYKSHTSCITEAEKYQKSLYRKKGNNNNNNAKQQQQKQQNKVAEEKPKDNKPVSLIEELKKKKEEGSGATEATKRKAEEDKDENKKKQKKSKWEEVELPLDNKAKVIQMALQEVLSKGTTSVSIKDCRKKVVKLIASHPKASKKLDKSTVKDAFDEAFLLGVEGDKLIVKTA